MYNNFRTDYQLTIMLKWSSNKGFNIEKSSLHRRANYHKFAGETV